MELRNEMEDLCASHQDAIAAVVKEQDVPDRMSNIIISGPPENKGENTKQAVHHLFTGTLKVASPNCNIFFSTPPSGRRRRRLWA